MSRPTGQKALGGDLRKLEARDLSAWEGRRRFLQTVHEMWPSCYGELVEIGPLYDAARMALGATTSKATTTDPGEPITRIVLGDPIQQGSDDGLLGAAGSSLSPGVRDFVKALEVWKRDWNLEAPWVTGIACRSLRLRQRLTTFAAPPFTDVGGLEGPPEFPTWFPTWESWATYHQRVDDALDEYRAQRLRAFQTTGGAAPGVVKRGNAQRHFQWLARYQVGNESYNAIAKDVLKSHQGISNGVKRTAASIGLPLRLPHRGGRPRR